MPDFCEGCGNPIREGEARYAAQEHKGVFWHFECREADAKKLEAELRRLGRGDLANYLERCRKDPFHAVFHKPPNRD